MRNSSTITGMLLVFTLVAALPTHAQTQRSGGGESARILQQYQQLAAEKTALQGQTAQLKKDLDDARKDLAAMKKERDALKARTGVSPAAVAQANTAKQAAETSLEQSKQRMTELVGRFRETAQTLKEVETDRNSSRKELADRNAAFDSCAETNLQLFEVTNEVLNRYEKVGLFTKASASEPFTRITRTRIENLVDEYRARALELRTSKAKPKT